MVLSNQNEQTINAFINDCTGSFLCKNDPTSAVL